MEYAPSSPFTSHFMDCVTNVTGPREKGDPILRLKYEKWLPRQRAKEHTKQTNDWTRKNVREQVDTFSKRNLQSNVSFCRQKGKATRIVEARLRCIKTDRHRTKASNERIIHKTLAYPMSQSTVSLRYSGSFSSLKSLWGEENNTENDEVGKEGRRPPKVAFLFSQAMQAASSRTHYFCPNKQAASSRASSKC